MPMTFKLLPGHFTGPGSYTFSLEHDGTKSELSLTVDSEGCFELDGTAPPSGLNAIASYFKRAA